MFYKLTELDMINPH